MHRRKFLSLLSGGGVAAVGVALGLRKLPAETVKPLAITGNGLPLTGYTQWRNYTCEYSAEAKAAFPEMEQRLRYKLAKKCFQPPIATTDTYRVRVDV